MSKEYRIFDNKRDCYWEGEFSSATEACFYINKILMSVFSDGVFAGSSDYILRRKAQLVIKSDIAELNMRRVCYIAGYAVKKIMSYE